MNKLMIGVAMSLISIPVLASSLEYLWSQQSQYTIEPVTYKGMPVAGHLGSASSICGSLGYTRTVAFEAEPCTSGSESVWRFTDGTASVGVSDGYECGDLSSNKLKLKSVTCAR